MQYFVGLDWAAREHAVCAVDVRGAVKVRFTVAHSAAGMTELAARLRKLAPLDQLCVAIERPSGLLVDTLVDGGFTVIPIHPNAVEAARPRYSAAQGKTAPGDACAQRFALASQLRALLDEFWPGPAALFADVDSAIALDFLDRHPTPQSAATLGEKRMAAFLARRAYCGRRSAAELLERLRTAPKSAGELEAEAKGECVRALVAVLRPLVAQIATLTAAAEHAVEAHADGKIITPIFRSGRVCAAQLLAELGDDRARFVSADHLAAEGGVAPVTRESGKHRCVGFRWACNKRLRSALTTLADTTRHTTPWAAAIYQRARDRGCDHPHAIRILARAWCRVIWQCWQRRTPYEPAKHRAAIHLNTLRLVEREAA